MLQQDGTNTVEAWSPDGRRLLCRERPEISTTTSLLDLESGDARLLTEHRDEALYLSPHFVGEDELILLANADSDFLAPAQLDLRTGSFARLEEPGWDVEYLAASPDGRVVAYAVNEDGYSRITVYVDGDNVQTSGLPSGVVSGLQLSAEGSVLAIDLNTPTTGANVWTMDPAIGEAVQVTRASLAGIAPEALVEPELVRYASFDGLEVPAFLYKPV
ncbi:MAG: S9 family peptidase, partial [Chloroflexia bacterium]